VNIKRDETEPVAETTAVDGGRLYSGDEEPEAIPGGHTDSGISRASSFTKERVLAVQKLSWVFAAIGLGVGLVAGFLIGFSAGANAEDDSSVPTETAAVVPLKSATTRCSASNADGVELGDEGQSLTITGYGLLRGPTSAQFQCLTDALDMPDSVRSRISATRALDGRQTATWDGLSASWTYHPDSGLNMVFEAY